MLRVVLLTRMIWTILGILRNCAMCGAKSFCNMRCLRVSCVCCCVGHVWVTVCACMSVCVSGVLIFGGFVCRCQVQSGEVGNGRNGVRCRARSGFSMTSARAWWACVWGVCVDMVVE